MNGFLLDENLPRRLRIRLNLPLTHASEIGESPSDTEVWTYAKKMGLAIITKDVDFSDRIAATSPPPWVIHLRIGNVRKRDYHTFLEDHWGQIYNLLPSKKLINVYWDRIEAFA